MTDKFFMWLAWRLPKRLVYWCVVRLTTSNSPQYPNCVLPELTVVEAIRRWTEHD